MADQADLKHRVEIAHHLQDLDSYDFDGSRVTPEELVIELGDETKYNSSSLVKPGQENLTGGSPRHWRLMLPNPRNPYGLNIVEFGHTLSDLTGLGNTSARFSQELFVDRVLDLNRNLNPNIPKRFLQIGGHAIKAARSQGHKVFAGIEVRYKEIDEDEVVQWAHLVYSKAILRTYSNMRGAVSKSATQRIRESERKDKIKNAETLALGSLVAAQL